MHSGKSPRKRAKGGAHKRTRIGRVSVYSHHGSWWVYYSDDGRQVRRKVAETREEAEQVAAQVNAQLATAAPTLLSFTPIPVGELRRLFLDYHEHVLKSAVATVNRYRTATKHLEDFISGRQRQPMAHEIKPDAFAAYLRSIEVAPNGHANSAKRKLRDKGIQFILETIRSMYGYASKRRHLPPYAGNPFAELPLDRLKIEDAKPIFVFDAAIELAFFRAASDWAFPIHFMLAKTGLRVGELTHLLIEELDLDKGWLTVRNKTGLGWRVKTGNERVIPLIAEVVEVLRKVIAGRTAGPVFLREKFELDGCKSLKLDQRGLEAECQRRQSTSGNATRSELLQVSRTVWRDAGAIKADSVRTSFLRVCAAIGLPHATCPKSWRHTFATLLQDANVDPLVRQITLGHKPSNGGVLGMTANYTHTRPETQRQQIEAALRQWPGSLKLAQEWAQLRSS